ncbi:MAG: nucleotidyltransferase family protein [Aquificae bacterium]|nr:nucleotidyltransferase family protein [Aquificota bacterium]
MKVLASILAGGFCTRFSYPKFLTLYGNRTLIEILIEEASYAFDQVIIVSGHYHRLLKIYTKVPVIYNRDYPKGMASSIRTTVKFAKEHNFDALCILPSDMPYINKKMLFLLKEYLYREKVEGVSFWYKDRPSPPAIFSHTLFDELLKLDGDKGARAVLKNSKSFYIQGYEDYLIDIDTLDNYIDVITPFI